MSIPRDHDEMVDGLKMLADKIDEVLQRLQAGEATDEDRRLARRTGAPGCCGSGPPSS